MSGYKRLSPAAWTRRRIYLADDTWTKPTDSRFLGVRLWLKAGDGGGGGSGSNNSIGGGGGGGSAAYRYIAAADLGATETVTVGAKGDGGAAGNNAGNAGGTSSFGSHVTCTGGAGGLAANGTDSSVAGGTASGGDLNYNGGVGWHPGTYTDDYRGVAGPSGVSPIYPAVLDASSMPASAALMGAALGGPGYRNPSWSATESPGGVGIGGGGAGGQRIATSNQPGGDGGPGWIIVEEDYGDA